MSELSVGIEEQRRLLRTRIAGLLEVYFGYYVTDDQHVGHLMGVLEGQLQDDRREWDRTEDEIARRMGVENELAAENARLENELNEIKNEAKEMYDLLGKVLWERFGTPSHIDNVRDFNRHLNWLEDQLKNMVHHSSLVDAVEKNQEQAERIAYLENVVAYLETKVVK